LTDTEKPAAPTVTHSHTETRLDSRSRLVYERKQIQTKPGQLSVDPQLRRILVIIDKGTAMALSHYMADQDDFRPGMILGGFTREALATRGYLKRTEKGPPEEEQRLAKVTFFREHWNDMKSEAQAKAVRMFPELAELPLKPLTESETKRETAKTRRRFVGFGSDSTPHYIEEPIKE
jgi:hypothetical protein